jgi:hypothetical protein
MHSYVDKILFLKKWVLQLHLQVQLHQLTPNSITHLSKYFWVIGSFGGVPSSNVLAKRYELHY